MCGLAGIFRRDGEHVDASLLAAMGEILAHRGPDASGLWCEGQIGLVHRRLSIRDPGPAANQPMSDCDGQVTVVYNGEIYNYDELRNELTRHHGVQFKTHCDTELLPAAYRVWGTDLFNRLEGMFAIALWDARQRQLVLARDGVGIKPLFVSVGGDAVRFGSELKAVLVDTSVSRELDSAALAAFLANGYVSPSETLLGSVEQLSPGSFRIYSETDCYEESFWKPSRNALITNMGEALEVFEALWSRVVNDMLVSDVTVGVQQSGGIDSSLVTLEASKARSLPVFTAGFTDQSFSELEQARSLVDHLPVQHVVIEIEETESAEAVFNAVVHGLDGQLADSSAFAVYQLNRSIRQHVKVVLSGDGADEFFAGYPTYRASLLAARLQALLPRSAWRAVARYLEPSRSKSESRLPRLEVFLRFCQGLAAPAGYAHATWRRLMTLEQIGRLMAQAQDVERIALQGYHQALDNGALGVIEQCLLADQRFYLPADMLMKVDAMSMAHGLEVRVPFLDRRVMEFAGSLDIALLTGISGPDKRLLRQYLQTQAVDRRIYKGRKRGFNVPVARLLRTSLRNLGERLLVDEVDRLSTRLRGGVIRQLWREHQCGKRNHGYALWTLLTLACWLKQLEER